jgi:hypothetical protein
MENLPLANKSFVEKKASAYAEAVKNLNRAREHGSQFKVRLVLFTPFLYQNLFLHLLERNLLLE